MATKKLFHNGEIFTCGPADLICPAMLTEGDRVLYVGEYVDALWLTDDDTEEIDLAGRAIIPVLTDCSIHPQSQLGERREAYSFLLTDRDLEQYAGGFLQNLLQQGVTTVYAHTDFGAETVRTLTALCHADRAMPHTCFLLDHMDGGEQASMWQSRVLDAGITTGFGDGSVRFGHALVYPLERPEERSLFSKLQRMVGCGISLAFLPKDNEQAVLYARMYERLMKMPRAASRGLMYLSFLPTEDTLRAITSASLGAVLLPLPDPELRHPLRLMLAMGLAVSFGSGHSALSMPTLLDTLWQYTDPLGGRGDHTVPLSRILRCLSYHGAIPIGLEREVGSLEWGKYADFSILSTPLLSASVDELTHTAPLATYFSGRQALTSATVLVHG